MRKAATSYRAPGFALLLSALALTARADDREQQCLLLALQSAAATTTVGELRALCNNNESSTVGPVLTTEAVIATAEANAPDESNGIVEQRLALQRYVRDNPFTLTALRPNYVLPLVYTKNPNNEPFSGADQLNWKNVEVQFQLSLQVLLLESLLGDNGHLSAGYTVRSFWQAYSNENSAPFRDTSHEPELIFTLENDWEIFGFTNVANQFILNHQSNGRGGNLSRSWNRVVFNAMFERDDLAFSFRPWYRLPEDDKDYPGDPGGDDNPDIERYLGHVETLAVWQHRENVFSMMLRNNLRSDNKGAVELSWSFPLGGRIKGYVKYFNGYGESLIDYNQSTESIGIGFLITDWL